MPSGDDQASGRDFGKAIPGVKRNREVPHGEVERPVGSSVNRGRNVRLILELAFHQAVASSPVGDDVGLADDARRLHPEGHEDPLAQEVSVELTGYRLD